jgi:hypothetical protein
MPVRLLNPMANSRSSDRAKVEERLKQRPSIRDWHIPCCHLNRVTGCRGEINIDEVGLGFGRRRIPHTASMPKGASEAAVEALSD